MSAIVIPDGPPFFTELSDWDSKKILACCRNVTLDKERGGLQLKYRKLWDQYLKYFEEGKSYPFEKTSPSGQSGAGIEIKTMEINLCGVTLKIHSSWCALAAVVNLIMPSYDPKEEGEIEGYCYSAVILLAKWATTISRDLEYHGQMKPADSCGSKSAKKDVKWTPPFFTASFAAKDDLKVPSKCKADYVVIVSSGKCINLPLCKDTTELKERLNELRWGQFITKFGKYDFYNCPFPIDLEKGPWLPTWIDGRGDKWDFLPPTDLKKIEGYIHKRPDGLLKETLKIFKAKVFDEKPTKGSLRVHESHPNSIGGCAELWGFLVMQELVKCGRTFSSITIDGIRAAGHIKLNGYIQTVIDICECPNKTSRCKKGIAIKAGCNSL